MRSEGEGDLDGWRQIVSWPYPPTSVTNLLTARRKSVTNVSRIAWIVGVGASRGLGAASARRFAREGYKVAVTGRSPDALQVIVDEIVAAGGQAIPAAGDAQQEAGMVDILDRLGRIGPVEVGVYNAGNAIWGRRSKQSRQISRRCGGSVVSAASSSGGRMLAACYHAATGLSSTPRPQQLFAEEQHLLHSPLLKLASGWSVNPSHANSGHAVFTSLTSSSTVPSRAIRSLARFLISDSRRGRTACCTLM